MHSARATYCLVARDFWRENMKKTIYKYDLNIADEQVVMMPAGATILSCQVQSGVPKLWALVDSSAGYNEDRKIMLFGTGHPVPDMPLTFIDTFQLRGGGIIFHVFEAAA